jgi:hypothetical protein
MLSYSSEDIYKSKVKERVSGFLYRAPPGLEVEGLEV